MRFYQKLRFRFTVTAVLLVTAVAILLTSFIQGMAKEVLYKHEVDAQLDETSLRFREVSAEIQVLRGDAVAIAGAAPVRGVQWAKRHEHGEMPEFKPPVGHLEQSAKLTVADFARLMQRRPAYLRIAYYLYRSKPQDGPLVVYNREGYSNRDFPPLRPDDPMIARAKRTDAEVSFSHVRPGEGKDIALLDACFPERADGEDPDVVLADGVA